MVTEAPDLADVVAANVRRLRQERGLNQELFASELRLCGLRWTRVTVTQFETRSGKTRRNVSLGEALALALALRVPLAALLEGQTQEVVNEDGRWPQSVVLSAIEGTTEGDPATVVVAPEFDRRISELDWSKVAKGAESILERVRVWTERWDTSTARREWMTQWDTPKARHDETLSRAGAAEETAAKRVAADRKLLVLPEDIVSAADRCWGRPVEEERERRLSFDPRAAGGSPGELRALRSQIMRRLYKELGKEVDAAVDRAVAKETTT